MDDETKDEMEVGDDEAGDDELSHVLGQVLSVVEEYMSKQVLQHVKVVA
ncbi:MAG: hypothetical protein WCG98_03235 [bacterium]